MPNGKYRIYWAFGVAASRAARGAPNDHISFHHFRYREVSPPGQKSLASGMDIIRKETDGARRIIRYMAYEAP